MRRAVGHYTHPEDIQFFPVWTAKSAPKYNFHVSQYKFQSTIPEFHNTIAQYHNNTTYSISFKMQAQPSIWAFLSPMHLTPGDGRLGTTKRRLRLQKGLETRKP